MHSVRQSTSTANGRDECDREWEEWEEDDDDKGEDSNEDAAHARCLIALAVPLLRHSAIVTLSQPAGEMRHKRAALSEGTSKMRGPAGDWKGPHATTLEVAVAFG
jgi:hypothetical protein